MLAWRPSLKEMRLVRADSQDWAKKYPEGSHRYPANWLEARYSWVTDEGAMKPKWDACGKGGSR